MPITSSAKKELRSSAKKRVFNVRRAQAMKNAIKSVKKAVEGGKKKEAQELLPNSYKAIDKAAKRGIIKKNTAARKKSRLTKLVVNAK